MTSIPLHPLLAEDSLGYRLAKSAQVALPLRKDFWGDLASGFGVSVAQIAKTLQELYEAQLIEGIWAEPNPSFAVHREALCVDTVAGSGACERWRAQTPRGQISSQLSTGERPSRQGWDGVQWFKTGWPVPLRPGELNSPLSKSHERSFLVLQKEELKETKVDHDLEGDLFASVCTPRRLLPPETVWDSAGKLLGRGGEEIRRELSGGIVSGRWRRLGLKWHYAGLPLQGCGLACWRLPEEEVTKAAVALAGTTGAADVCIREATEQFPYNLGAVLMARTKGRGAEIAQSISNQWGRDLGDFVPFEWA